MIPEELIARVRAFFAGDASGHDWFHTARVTSMARALARQEGADEELCALAALLHDVDDYKLTGGAPGASANAQRLLERFGYPAETRRRVAEIIAAVSFKGTDSAVPATLEGRIVQDADRLDAIGAIGIARAFAFGGSRGRAIYDPNEPPVPDMDADRYVRHRGPSLNHFYEKLLLLRDLMNTPSARAIAEGRHRVMEAFLEEFLAEWDARR